MNSHYSTRDQRCYAQLWLDTDPERGPYAVFSESFVFDVDENRAKGELRLQLNVKPPAEPTIIICAVGNAKCRNFAEWEELVKPYMEQ
jgi:hypothetical protein